MARTKIQPSEQKTQVSSEPAGYIITSRTMMRSILEEDPMNIDHAKLVVKTATSYNKYWDDVTLEFAREIARRLNGHT